VGWMNNELHSKIEKIEAVFPHEILALQVHDEGDDFCVIEVNGVWMFRFPRNPSARTALECERQFLPRFERLSSISIPKCVYAGEGYVGYRKVEGVLLTRPLMDTLNGSIRRRVAQQLGEFLSALHSFPVEEAEELGLTRGWGGWRKRAYERLQQEVVPGLSTKARESVEMFFNRYFSLEWKAVVIHGDFHPPDHVFYDPELEELAGVIDFGDLTLEDAATDFKSIFEEFGEGYLREVMGYYSGSADEGIVDRVKLRIEADPLFGAAYAIEYGFDGRLRRHLTEIEMAFGTEVRQWGR